MYVKQVSLKNFRNLDTMSVELTKGINLFYGDNAQGKTNFLESVYLCATGRSQRTHTDKELIAFNAQESYIQLEVENEGINDKISIHLKKDRKKGVAVNSVPVRRLGDLFGTLLVVIFSPEDMQLVKAGPAERRRFMDMELCQLSKVYYHELGDYYRILKQRNNLLKKIQKDHRLKDTLFVWDEQLVLHGIKIMGYRKEFINNISALSSEIYASITDKKESFTMSYKPNATEDGFLEKLKKNADRDLALGSTSAGIHKDDVLMTIDDLDVRAYGSQGQQRSAALCAKLAEINLICNQKGRTPVLLLDDVLSELDESRQRFLLSHLANVQTILTCTGVEDVLKKLSLFKDIRVFNVSKGQITQE